MTESKPPKNLHIRLLTFQSLFPDFCVKYCFKDTLIINIYCNLACTEIQLYIEILLSLPENLM